MIDLLRQWNVLSKFIPLSHTIDDQTSQAQTMKLQGEIGVKKKNGKCELNYMTKFMTIDFKIVATFSLTLLYK